MWISLGPQTVRSRPFDFVRAFSVSSEVLPNSVPGNGGKMVRLVEEGSSRIISLAEAEEVAAKVSHIFSPFNIKAN